MSAPSKIFDESHSHYNGAIRIYIPSEESLVGVSFVVGEHVHTTGWPKHDKNPLFGRHRAGTVTKVTNDALFIKIRNDSDSGFVVRKFTRKDANDEDDDDDDEEKTGAHLWFTAGEEEGKEIWPMSMGKKIRAEATERARRGSV